MTACSLIDKNVMHFISITTVEGKLPIKYIMLNNCAVVSCGRRGTQPFPLSSRMVETRSQTHSKEFHKKADEIDAGPAPKRPRCHGPRMLAWTSSVIWVNELYSRTETPIKFRGGILHCCATTMMWPNEIACVNEHVAKLFSV